MILTLSLMVMPAAASASDYHSSILPSTLGNTTINWNVLDAPNDPFGLFFSGTGAWSANTDTQMTFVVTKVDADVQGVITLGNATWTGNNSDIAKDLTLSVWGLIPWMPGLVVKIGNDNMANLNQTAHLAAERVYGNYVNGSMSSSYESVTVSGNQYDCIVFDYAQDPSGFGEPQRTYLAYDTTTGVLVLGNTSYSFGTPYSLVLSIASITTVYSPLVIVGGVALVGLVVVLVLIAMRRR